MFARRILTVAVAVAAMSACTVDSSKAPDLTGPSTLGLNIEIKASPDMLYRDGISTSVIEVTASSGSGQPVAGLAMQIVPSPNLGTVDKGAVTPLMPRVRPVLSTRCRVLAARSLPRLR